VPANPQSPQTTKSVGLRPNSMSWLGAGLMGAVIMSPAGGIYFNFAPTEVVVGRLVPLIVFIAMIVTLPTALSYASMSRSLPSAGNAYTWMRQATNPTLGVFVGWILNGFYLLAQVVVPGIAALFFNEILAFFGLPVSYATWALGVVLLSVVVLVFNFRGVEITLRTTVVFLLVETVIVTALMVTIFVVQTANGALTVADIPASFDPAQAAGGTAALSLALIFGIQGNVGFDAVSTLTEETRFPRRFIPIATLFAVVGIGVYWIITGFGYVSALPVSEVVEIVGDGGSPIVTMATIYWGAAGRLLISVLALTSILAIFISQNTASSRALYGMGREGAAPRWVGVIHPGSRVPRNAMIVGLVVTVVATLILGAVFGIANQFAWSATITSALALLTYLSVNVSNLLYHWRRRRAEFRWFMHGVVPILGILVVGFVLASSYLASLWNAGWEYGRSVQLAIVLWLIGGVIWTLYLRRKRPELFIRRSDDEVLNRVDVDDAER
jgi:amino acid transporter